MKPLILGVTPELYRLNWPAGTVVHAVDRAQEMIGAIWVGPPGDAVHGEWLHLPFGDAAFDCVACDGGLHLLGYPDDQKALARSVAVMQDLSTGRIASFHAFKLRLAMSLQQSPIHGVVLDGVYRYLLNAVGSLDQLVRMTGWPQAEVMTVSSYRDSPNVYHFLTEERSIEALCAESSIVLEDRRESHYPLGDRCPVLSFRKRLA